MSAFLYFLAMAFTIPVLPKIVNEIIGKGQVTAKSATVYGLLTSVDASFTLLTVNFHGTLSDLLGRRPFFALSSLGLGIGFTLTSLAKNLWMLVLAAAIDGCTSCMYSIAQASVTDCVGEGQDAKLSEAFGVFQGLALGCAFMIGLPLGGVLGATKGYRFSMSVSVVLCALNVLMVGVFMPESLPKSRRKKEVDLSLANPLGAIKMASRNNLISGVTVVWMLLWIAHCGMQINWINYTEVKFGWSMAQSGASLAVLGALVAVVPKLIIPRLGMERSISFGLLVYAMSQVLIGVAPGQSSEQARLGAAVLMAGIVLTAVGTVVFPATLAYLNHQVAANEKGALQGAADTAKTLCSAIGSPSMAWVFGFFMSERAWPRQVTGANYYVGACIALVAWAYSLSTFNNHGHESLHVEPEDAAFDFEAFEP